jgi:hypothetical protein
MDRHADDDGRNPRKSAKSLSMQEHRSKYCEHSTRCRNRKPGEPPQGNTNQSTQREQAKNGIHGSSLPPGRNSPQRQNATTFGPDCLPIALIGFLTKGERAAGAGRQYDAEVRRYRPGVPASTFVLPATWQSQAR